MFSYKFANVVWALNCFLWAILPETKYTWMFQVLCGLWLIVLCFKPKEEE